MHADSMVDLRLRLLSNYLFTYRYKLYYEISGYKLTKQLGDSQVVKRLPEAAD